MAHHTQSSQSIKDSESDYSIGMQINSNGSSTSRSSTSDTPVLRRSYRESLKKNNTLSPCNTRKSERLDKPIPETTPAKMKSEKVENKSTPSPLRRSERGKSPSSTSSASEPLLTNGTSEKKEESTLRHGQVKKLLNSRAYIARYLKHADTPGFVPKHRDKLTPQLLYNSITEDVDSGCERVHVDGTALKAPELTISTSNGRISDVHCGLEGSDRITVSNSKRKMADSGSDDSGLNASKDICSVVDTSSALPSGCTGDVPTETCGICFKRQRVDQDPIKQESCLCGVNKRNRKRGKHTDEQSTNPQVESVEVVKRQKKVGFSNSDLASLKPEFEGKSTPVSESGASVTQGDCVPCSFSSVSAFVNKNNFAIPKIDNSKEKRKLIDAQKNLHLHMKPEISKLCGILQFSDVHRDWVEKFLEYLVNNHYVIRESATTQQAFQISVCWTVASILKHKLDHKVSFALAKQHLNFNCQKEEADRVYLMLQCLKKVFRYRTGNFIATDSPNFSDSNNGTTPNLQGVRSVVEDYWIYLVKKDLSKCINKIKEKFQKKMKKLVQKQYEERSRILKFIDLEKEKLEMKHNIEFAVNRIISASADRLKIIEIDFEEETEKLRHRVQIQLQYLEKLQLEARLKLKKKEDQQIEEVQTWVYDELWNRLPPNAPDKILACHSPVRTCTTPIGLSMSNGPLVPVNSEIYDSSEKETNDISGDNHVNVHSEIPCAKELMTNRGSSLVNGEALPDVLRLCSSKVFTSRLPSIDESIDESDKFPVCDRNASTEDLVNVSSTDGPLTHSAAEQCPHGAALNMPNRETPLEPHDTGGSIHDVNDLGSVSPCGSEEHHRFVTENVPGNEAESAVVTIVGSTDAVGKFHSEAPPSSEQLIAGNLTGIVNNEVCFTASDVATRFDQQKGVVSELSSSAQLVATIESERSHHELTTNIPRGPSPETPDPSLQVSSASGIPEIESSRERSIQDIFLATSCTKPDGNARGNTELSSSVQLNATIESEQSRHELSSNMPEGPSSETPHPSPQISSAFEIPEIEPSTASSIQDIVLATPYTAHDGNACEITDLSSSAQLVTTIESEQSRDELTTNMRGEPSSATPVPSPQVSSPSGIPEIQPSRAHSTQDMLLATLYTAHDGNACKHTDLSSSAQLAATIESEQSRHQLTTSMSGEPSCETPDPSPQVSSPSGIPEIQPSRASSIQDTVLATSYTGHDGNACKNTDLSSSAQLEKSRHELTTNMPGGSSSGTPDPSPQVSSPSGVPEIQPSRVSIIEDIILATSCTGNEGSAQACENTCQSGESLASQNVVIRASDHSDHVESVEQLSNRKGISLACAFEHQTIVNQDTSILLDTSTTIQDGDGRVTGNQITCQPVENPVSQSVVIVESDHEVPTNSTLVSLQLPPEDRNVLLPTSATIQDGDGRVTGNQITCQPVESPASQSIVIVESDHEVPTTSTLASLELPLEDTSILLATSATVQDGDGRGTGNQMCQPVESPVSQSVAFVESDPEVPTDGTLVSLQLPSEDRNVILATSATIQDGDGRGTGNQIMCQPVENPASQSIIIVESDHEVPTTTTLASLQLPPEETSILLATSATVQDRDGLGTGNQITYQPVESPVSQSVAFVESDPEVPTNASLTSLHLPLESAAGGIEVQPRREDHTSNQISQDPVQLVTPYSDQSTETPLQSAASPSLHGPINMPQPISIPTNGTALSFSGVHTASVSNNHNTHAAPQGTLRVPHYSYPDPLQNELERLNKEIERKIKLHEEMKLRLKSDYEKKIEKAVAELRRRCETILQKEEAEFQRKQKELEANHDKVLMNKILAEAFRSKCMDFRGSNASGVQQDRNSSVVQQLVQLSVQQNTQRASSVSSLSSMSIPASSLQTSGALNLQITPPTSVIAPSQHYTAPIMQTVPLSSASPSIPVRPPQIATLSGPTGISQGGFQVRSTAPHLRPIRPSASVAGTSPLSQQGGMSNILSSLPATSPSTRMPQMSAPTRQTVPSSRVEHVSSGCRDMEQQPGANQQGGLCSLPALDSCNYPGPIFLNNAAANPVNTTAIPEVVCLSDDD